MLNMFRGVAEYMTPVLTTSQFQEKGMLTPEQFVEAGDQLVFKCQTWQWASGETSMAKKYLPPDKQFLITRNVPSLCRASTYALEDAPEKMVEEDDGDDGWLSTHVNTDFSKQREDVGEIQSMDDVEEETASAQLNNLRIDNTYMANADIPDIADDIPDIDAAGFGIVEDDEATLSTADAYLTASEPEDNVVRTRTYDLTITYDNFYRTPRIYLFGYDERRQPLTSDKVMEDISTDHANKTVTVDPHPHTGIPCASIHPCRHASVMKKLIDMRTEAEEASKTQDADTKEASKTQDVDTTEAAVPVIDVGQYMFLFLKFIAAVIPTIDYDYTLSA